MDLGGFANPLIGRPFDTGVRSFGSDFTTSPSPVIRPRNTITVEDVTVVPPPPPQPPVRSRRYKVVLDLDGDALIALAKASRRAEYGTATSEGSSFFKACPPEVRSAVTASL